MKKHIISLLVGLSLTNVAMADDLMQVYQAAKQNDPQILKAQAAKDVAYSQIDSAKASLLPSVDLSVSTGRSRKRAPEADPTTGALVKDWKTSGSTTASVGLKQAIYRPDLWSRYDTAEKSASQSDANLGFATQGLMVRTVAAYFEVLRAQDELEFAVSEKKAIERQLEQTSQRHKVGLTAITDVHEAQAQFDTAVASEISARNKVEVQREALREITGMYHNDLSVLNTDKFAADNPQPNDINQWVNIGESQNLQLLASKIGVDIAKENINLAKTGHLPTVSLSADVGTGTGDTLSFSNPRSDSMSIGLSLNVPLYKGGATDASVEQAKQNFIITSQDREATHRQMVRSIRSNYYDVIAGVSRIKALEQAVVSAESALNATQAGFEVGTRTIVDVLNSTRNLFSAKSRLSSARYGYITSILSLKQAAGSLSEEDIQGINNALK